MENKKERDIFWETDLADIQKTYLPEGKVITDLRVIRTDGRIPVPGRSLAAENKADRVPKDE